MYLVYIRHFTGTLVVMLSLKINACSVFALWRICALHTVSVAPHPHNQSNTKDTDVTSLPNYWQNDVQIIFSHEDSFFFMAGCVLSITEYICNRDIKLEQLQTSFIVLSYTGTPLWLLHARGKLNTSLQMCYRCVCGSGEIYFKSAGHVSGLNQKFL